MTKTNTRSHIVSILLVQTPRSIPMICSWIWIRTAVPSPSLPAWHPQKLPSRTSGSAARTATAHGRILRARPVAGILPWWLIWARMSTSAWRSRRRAISARRLYACRDVLPSVYGAGWICPPIRFKKRLNVVLGKEDGANSIGKSSATLGFDGSILDERWVCKLVESAVSYGLRWLIFQNSIEQFLQNLRQG